MTRYFWWVLLLLSLMGGCKRKEVAHGCTPGDHKIVNGALLVCVEPWRPVISTPVVSMGNPIVAYSWHNVSDSTMGWYGNDSYVCGGILKIDDHKWAAAVPGKDAEMVSRNMDDSIAWVAKECK